MTEQSQNRYNRLHELWYAWQKADDAWMEELKKVFGRDACNARYEERGKTQTAALGEKCAAVVDCNRAWHSESARLRDEVTNRYSPQEVGKVFMKEQKQQSTKQHSHE